jgi:hypothetical protein
MAHFTTLVIHLHSAPVLPTGHHTSRELMNISLRILVFGLLALLCVEPARSQNTNPVIYDPKPFDNNVEYLPPNYVGNSYFDILTALAKRSKVAARGEFESTIDYNARIGRTNSQVLAEDPSPSRASWLSRLTKTGVN